ncbi:mannosyltransferase (PIG-V, glycosyl transferase family 76) [Metarhizium robertsii]|uniref:GPI mannosyltransferase 2 n=2 Tax=Metarhizium robertsii TaxID=568076 RepID=E9ENZ3_METRA|nr:glycosyltransferase family 76 protein [Metarhizium robertsii ARSEF 23]EFZ02420.1 glycosyltransferase family 76 protein [Metarhizium robertsii ARSEF 23]EXV05612.1 mannosyltransferase (PIG-V, glycosyl transferase family 76) [Metarhizium robertsii]
MDLFPSSQPIRSLTALFIAWKGFLLAVSLGAAVAPDYDTSTSLFFDRMYGHNITIPTIAARLTRWDALYFMHSAIRGYTYEQEWAFGLGLPTIVGAISRSLSSLAPANYALEPLVAIALAHASHFVAMLALHRLTMILSGNSKLAFVSSALHILSPAGLFLSAPYNESPFAGLSFMGNLLFAVSLKSKADRVKRNMTMLASGILFGVATAFRSNGLASGLLFAVQATDALLLFARAPSLCTLLSMIAPVLGGLCVAAGSVVPQTVAWMRYCGSDGVGRPWCEKMIPSIYTFVQDHYWNVGFLRYWTLNQLPLFLLASPMLAILIKSGLDLIVKPQRITNASRNGAAESDLNTFVRALAGSQVLIAILAITTYHVQIITRISSGYPAWYWWVGSCLMDKRRQGYGVAIVMFMVMYGGIQGGLFASFLPPA